MPKGKKPDYVLRVKDKLSDGSNDVGVAWQNTNGGITIKLNPCVILTAENTRDCYLTLWPKDSRARTTRSRNYPPDASFHVRPPKSDEDIPSDPLDDDIPF